MEGVWFAYEREDGSADLSARQGDRPHGASAAPARPSPLPSIRRRSAGLETIRRRSYDPRHELHPECRLPRRPAADDADEAQPGPRRSESACSATSFPRPLERRLRLVPARLARPRVDQRDRREHGASRLWKFKHRREPERGGVSTTDSGLGFAGGGDGVLRAFDLKKRQGAVDPSRPATRSRPARRSTSVDGKQYIAVTSGGTPDVVERAASRVSCRSFAPRRFEEPSRSRRCARLPTSPHPSSRATRRRPRLLPLRMSSRVASGAGRMSMQAGLVVQPWKAKPRTTPRRRRRPGVLRPSRPGCRSGGACSAATRSRGATAKDGTFRSIPLDITGRAPVNVATVTQALRRATAGGHALSGSQRSGAARHASRVQRRLRDRTGSRRSGSSNGTVPRDRAASTTPRAERRRRSCSTRTSSAAVVDGSGGQAGARGRHFVVTRTADRDLLDVSRRRATRQGHYTSFFSASDEAGCRSGAARRAGRGSGRCSYGRRATGHELQLQATAQASSVNIQLPNATAKPLPVTATRELHGRCLRGGLVVGVTVGGRVVKAALGDVARTRTARSGMVLAPRQCAARTLHFLGEPAPVPSRASSAAARARRSISAFLAERPRRRDAGRPRLARRSLATPARTIRRGAVEAAVAVVHEVRGSRSSARRACCQRLSHRASR